MITAKDVHEKIKNLKLIDEDVLDSWIEKNLIHRLVVMRVAHIPYNDISFTKDSFITCMSARGFDITYVCEDRPCANPYYRITIPPQEG